MEAMEAVAYLESPAPPSSRRPGVFRSCAIYLGILLASLFVEAFILLMGLVALEGDQDWVDIQLGPHPVLGFDRAPRIVLDSLATRCTMGGPVAAAWILSAPVVVLLCLLAARSLGPSAREALGLRLPSLRQALGWAAAVAAFWLSLVWFRIPGLETGGGQAVSLYRTAYWLPLLYLGSVLAAPLIEELLVRGFLVEALRRSRLGASGAVCLAAALWSVPHLGNLANPLALLFFGVLLGFARLRSGSTYLTIALHGLVNLAILLQTGIYIDHSGTNALLDAARSDRGQHEYYQALWNLRDAERFSHGPCPECALERAHLFLAASEPDEAAKAARRAIRLATSPAIAAQGRELLGQATEAEIQHANGSP
ncbi:MAG TPA: CPBP family intramembrane glutamic endopeptidase [Thermoanaerobaculia bacterium]|nr:CPBP family intramembrane glutamic endopeptidase [Thermoanaerobaculia bacterium]